MLALVLMQPFDLHIEQRGRVHDNPRVAGDILRKLHFVLLFDAAIALTKRLIVGTDLQTA